MEKTDRAKCKECDGTGFIRTVIDFEKSYEYKPEISAESKFYKFIDVECPYCEVKKLAGKIDISWLLTK